MGAACQGRILVVEDENLLRGLIAQFLRMEGFDVVEAADGREGVERFSGMGPFDVVLLDLNLPASPESRSAGGSSSGNPTSGSLSAARPSSTDTSPHWPQ